ncbi:MAG: DUF3499 domain-containing protein [Actinobacteria bacterium]|nr:DUF3499 domain-containing protein [Actinomycetota bacterium]
MSELDRVCQRAGCPQPASVTLSFRYDARQASLVDLLPEKHPALYDLCDAHADLLIVPRGWERLDRRTPAADPSPIATADRAPDPAAAPRMDRYAALTAQLPRLAEAVGAPGPERGTGETRPGTQLFEPVTRALLPDDVLDGQLQMPIESESEGVVVALTRSRNL